jgi:hypothetical protein
LKNKHDAFSPFWTSKKAHIEEMVYKAFRPVGATFARFVSLSISSEGVVQRRFSAKWQSALHVPLAPGYPLRHFCFTSKFGLAL